MANAQNSVVRMPMPSVTAVAHRTGADENSTAAAMKVVMLGPDGGERAGEAGVDRRDRRAAAAHLLADALVDQHVGSTAMLTVSTMPILAASASH